MTEPTPAEQPQPNTPSRRDRLRPLELVGFSGVLALFAGGVVAFTRVHPTDMHPLAFAAIVVGVVFIIVLMVVALLGLGGQPSEEDLEARKDLRRPEDGGHTWH